MIKKKKDIQLNSALPFHQMHTGSHQETRSLCSGSQCDQCGWSSACSWPGSTPMSKGHTMLGLLCYKRHRVSLSELCSHK